MRSRHVHLVDMVDRNAGICRHDEYLQEFNSKLANAPRLRDMNCQLAALCEVACSLQKTDMDNETVRSLSAHLLTHCCRQLTDTPLPLRVPPAPIARSPFACCPVCLCTRCLFTSCLLPGCLSPVIGFHGMRGPPYKLRDPQSIRGPPEIPPISKNLRSSSSRASSSSSSSSNSSSSGSSSSSCGSTSGSSSQ